MEYTPKNAIQLACCVQNFNQWTFEEAARLTAELGFRVADIGKGQIGGFEAIRENPEAVGARIRKTAEASGLRISELSVFDVPAPHCAEDPQAAAAEIFRKCCAAAAAGGVESILGSIAVTVDPADDSDTAWEQRAEQYACSVAIGNEFGLPVNVEPVFNGPLVRRPDKAVWLAEQVPGLGYTVDFAHFPAAGKAVSEAYALLPHARHLHAKQAASGFAKSLFHNGVIDFLEVIAELRRVDWQGVMAIECLAYGKEERFDFELYQEVTSEFKTLPAIGLLNHPAFQTIRLAYELEQILGDSRS